MSFPKVLFKVTENNKCPLFSFGDTFSVTGITISMTNEEENTLFSTVIITSPLDKEKCKVLSSDLAKILIQYERAEKIPVCLVTCSGCTGSLRLEHCQEDTLEDLEFDTNSNPAELESILHFLKDFEFFKSIDEKNVKKVAQYFKINKFKADDIVIRKGSPGGNFFIIVTGSVNVINTVGITISTLKQGDVFGEMSLICNDPVSATIQVCEPSAILYIDRKNFLKIIDQYPAIQLYFTRLMAKRLSKSNTIRAQDLSSGMIGNLSEIPAEALFQILNMNQKTGILTITELSMGTARFSFRQGALIKAKYGDISGEGAFYKILKEPQGRFRFNPGIPTEEFEIPEIGYFMKLLMEGMRRLDEGRNQNVN
ncbi:MAG: cyclic nucleotide-binding domain-containing protein [Desulfocapsaceae bacterium]|nr:cyclic nucleotide-binding domain-containing protein [Desulfocapsaceae bacterium]